MFDHWTTLKKLLWLEAIRRAAQKKKNQPSQDAQEQDAEDESTGE